MNIVKWMRKNNRQLMAGVVIVIMISFVGGSALQQILSHMAMGANRKVATYRNNGVITPLALREAESELLILREMNMPLFLQYKPTAAGMPDIRARLIGQLLFPDSQASAYVHDELRNAILRGGIAITPDQINAFFEKTGGRGDVYWILLRAEARQAGYLISSSQAKETLRQLIPQLFQNRADAAMLVSAMIQRHRVPEERIYRIFADLLSILGYTEMMSRNEAVTTEQIRAEVGRRSQQISGEYVLFAFEDFVQEVAEPTEQELQDQLKAFNTYFAGQVSDDNPYGYGYKIPTRVQLEYIIIRNDTIQKTLPEPAAEEMEEYYRRHLDEFKEDVAPDPNKPETKVSKTKTYAEVAPEIRQSLLRIKAMRQADMIIAEAKLAVDAGFESVDMEKADTATIQKAAGNYAATAETLGKKYAIDLFTGTTGLLSAEDIAGSRTLGRLMVEGQTQMPIRLSRIAFAVDEAGTIKLGRFETQKPKMWATLGPMKDRFDEFGSMTALIRVVKVEQEIEPQDPALTYNKNDAVADTITPVADTIFILKDLVARDVKLQKASALARARAEEFVGMIGDQPWDKAIEAYNAKYTKADDPLSAAKKLRLDRLMDRPRASDSDVKMMSRTLEDDPSMRRYFQDMVNTNRQVELLHSLLPADKTEADNLKQIAEFKPGGRWYVIKKIARKDPTKDDYRKSKAMAAYQIDTRQGDSLALILLDPDNLRVRMQYQQIEQDVVIPAKPSIDDIPEEF